MERKRDLRHFRACRYITKGLFEELDSEYEGIISMINAMEKNAQKFCF